MTTALNGYCAKLTGAALDAVLSDPNVDHIEEDGNASVKYETIGTPTTVDPVGPVGPDHAGPPCPDHDNGGGVDIYVLGETLPYAA
jgi:hypothetical protein